MANIDDLFEDLNAPRATQKPADIVNQIPEDSPNYAFEDLNPNAPKTFGERIEDIRQERMGNLEATGARYLRGEASNMDVIGQVWGNSIGAAYDVVGETITSALGSMLPKPASQFLKGWLESEAAATSEGLKKVPAVKELISWYDNLSENDQATYAGWANVLAGAVPKMPNTGKALKKVGVEGEKEKLAEKMGDYSRAGREERAGELGMPLEQAYATRREKELMATLKSVKGVSMAKKSEANMKAINDELVTLRGKVSKALGKSNVRMTRSQIKAQMGLAFQAAQAKNAVLGTKSLKSYKAKVDEAMDAALADFPDSGLTPRQIHEIRIKFDNNVKDMFAKEDFFKDGTPRKFATPLRDRLNQLVEQSVDDENIQALLRRQHLLLVGKQNLKGYIATKGKQGIGQKVTSAAERHPVITAGLLGGSGGKVLENIGQSEIAALALGGLGVGLTATNPKVQQMMGTLLQANPVGVGRAGLFYGAPEQQEQQ